MQSRDRRRVAVVVLTFNAGRFIEDCFGSLRRARRDGFELDVIAVDNASQDDTVRRLREEYPEVRLVQNDRNLGFTGGNNVGIRLALEEGADFVYLLNHDTEVNPDFLAEALEVATRSDSIGSVQSLLVLASERDRINSAGNAIHFLGFGYCRGYRAAIESAPREPIEIAYASGAAVLLRSDALRAAGLFDDDLFAYHEDLDLGWRFRLAGFANVLAPRSVVFHKYEFSRNTTKYFLMERNRFVVLLKNLRARNLLLLAPFLLVGELGLFAMAALGGWLPQKWRATLALFRPSAWSQIRRGRAEQRRLRKVSDAEIVRHFTGVIEFEGVSTPFVRRVVNPVLAASWTVLRRWVA